jgi:hypothetical protein
MQQQTVLVDASRGSFADERSLPTAYLRASRKEIRLILCSSRTAPWRRRQRIRVRRGSFSAAHCTHGEASWYCTRRCCVDCSRLPTRGGCVEKFGFYVSRHAGRACARPMVGGGKRTFTVGSSVTHASRKLNGQRLCALVIQTLLFRGLDARVHRDDKWGTSIVEPKHAQLEPVACRSSLYPSPIEYPVYVHETLFVRSWTRCAHRKRRTSPARYTNERLHRFTSLS